MVSIFLAIGSVLASKGLFQQIIKHVLRNPISFFDSTPNGRILNRLGKDVDTIDNVLPIQLRMLIAQLLSVGLHLKKIFLYIKYKRICLHFSM